MGGLLFGTERLPLKEFNEYKKNIELLLDFYDIDYKVPLYYRDKKDFGDLDIIIKNTVPTQTLLKLFTGCECRYDQSETTISFNYKGFQIDFIRINPENFEIAFYYFSYNDLGNLIGQLAKINYLKFGSDGLKYQHYLKGQKIGTINISKDIDKILTFLDLNPSKFHEGFNSLKEIFDYIIDSKYFNPYVSDLEPYGYSEAGVALYRLNKINRERNYKRKTYQEWLQYIKRYKIGEDKYKFREDDDINEIFDRIDNFFPESKFKEKIEKIKKLEEDKLKLKNKFNGNIIKKLIPELNYKDFQFFIDSFKENVLDGYRSFDDYVYITNQDVINKDIINFYNNVFKKKYS
jgi:AraC-like DNA-binding protein